MKSILPLAVASVVLALGAEAKAADYSDAIAACKAAIEDKMETPATHNILKAAKQQGAHKVSLSFEVYRRNGSGEEVLNKASCLAAHRTGEVLAVSLD